MRLDSHHPLQYPDYPYEKGFQEATLALLRAADDITLLNQAMSFLAGRLAEIVQDAMTDARSRKQASRFSRAATWHPIEPSFLGEVIGEGTGSLTNDSGLRDLLLKFGLSFARLQLMMRYAALDRAIIPDWDEVYATFDGTMESCLGKDCPSSCCAVKRTVHIQSSREIRYRTSFLEEPAELRYREARLPILDPKTIGLVGSGGFAPGFIHDCSDPATQTCRLADERPLHCRTAPFLVTRNVAVVDPKCPAASEIARESGVIEKMLEIRFLLGLWPQDEFWLEDVAVHLEE